MMTVGTKIKMFVSYMVCFRTKKKPKITSNYTCVQTIGSWCLIGAN